MSVNYRCTLGACGRKRRTLKKRKELYIKEPVCLVCGTPTLGPASEKERNRKRACRCDGWPFIHSRGTAPWCVDSKREPTEDDYIQRYQR